MSDTYRDGSLELTRASVEKQASMCEKWTRCDRPQQRSDGLSSRTHSIASCMAKRHPRPKLEFFLNGRWSCRCRLTRTRDCERNFWLGTEKTIRLFGMRAVLIGESIDCIASYCVYTMCDGMLNCSIPSLLESHLECRDCRRAAAIGQTTHFLWLHKWPAIMNVLYWGGHLRAKTDDIGISVSDHFVEWHQYKYVLYNYLHER